MKSYFDEVFEILDNMSDEDFDKLLIESGIDNCPYEPQYFKIRMDYSENFSSSYLCKNVYFKENNSEMVLPTNREKSKYYNASDAA